MVKMTKLTLISHALCPYVQRAAIALSEKSVDYERIDIDLANKPDWFLQISPLGKTPVLKVGENAIFESAVLLEYLEETQRKPLHPKDPLKRAQHRAWIEFGSAILNDIGGFYSANDKATFDVKTADLERKFQRLEQDINDGKYFEGERFSLVDAVFGPIFRYFDVFDKIGDFGILSNKPKVNSWRHNLKPRPSIKNAVSDDYETLLFNFLQKRSSYLSKQIANPQNQ